MARSVVGVIRQQLQDAFEAIRERVEGLTDEEFFWQPVARCWTVRRRDDGRWTVDYPEPPHPDPAPFTTIGWRLVHVAECKIMYHEYAFGEAKLTFPEIDSAHTAAAAIAQLEAGHAMLVRDLAGLGGAGLGNLVLREWG